MKPRSFDAVLFDLDGTLVDSAPDLGAAADQMRTDRGMSSLDPSVYRPLAGSGASGMLGAAFGITSASADFEALREEFYVIYENRMLAGTLAFAGVQELLAELVGAGLAWGVVTNKSVRFTEPLTRNMSMFSTAGPIVSGDTTPFSKPHPAPLLEAAKRLGVLPRRCIYVGDDERDIMAGRAAGMKTVAANYGYLGAQGDISLWNADSVIASPLDLLQILKLT